MKTLLIISLCLLSLVGFAADYTYAGDPITKRTYGKLFRQFKTKLFVLSDGKVICPVDPSGKAKKISFSKKQLDGGEISGTVQKVIDKNTFTLKAKETVIITHSRAIIKNRKTGKKMYEFVLPGNRFKYSDKPERQENKYFTVAISGADTSKLFAGETFTANVIPTGAYVLKGTQYLDGQLRMRKFDILKPITAAEFKKYLDDGNKLYTYRKRLSGYAKCERCQGKGHLPNPKNANRKNGKMKEPDLNCPDCKYGKNPVYKYTKIAVKPKLKKIASR
jgi:hypothetical protein